MNGENKIEKTAPEKVEKTDKGKVEKKNYTPYRKAYNKAKSELAKRHNKEFKEILAKLLKA